MKIIETILHMPDQSVVFEAAETIRKGGVVALPFDTCYGLAADPANSEAVQKLFRIKQRAEDKAVSCVFGSIAMIEDWALLTDSNRTILENNLPGCFTFLLEPNDAYPFAAQGALLGARIPDSPLTRALSLELGAPYTATSANISGKPAAYAVEQLLAQLENDYTGAIFVGSGIHAVELPDIVIDAGPLPHLPVSTVVDLTVNPLRIVREGGGVLKM